MAPEFATASSDNSLTTTDTVDRTWICQWESYTSTLNSYFGLSGELPGTPFVIVTIPVDLFTLQVRALKTQMGEMTKELA